MNAISSIPPISLLSGADFSGKRGYAVAADTTANTCVIASAAGQKVLGILLDQPAAAGRACSVQTNGRVRAVAGSGGVAAGDMVKAAADGRLITATTSYVDTSDGGSATDPVIGSYVLGFALSAAAAGEYFDIEITHSGAVARTAI